MEYTILEGGRGAGNFKATTCDPDYLHFRFTLLDGWSDFLAYLDKLYRDTRNPHAHDCHKIFGITDFLGYNSVRLTLNYTLEGKTPIWRPCLYQHTDSRKTFSRYVMQGIRVTTAKTYDAIIMNTSSMTASGPKKTGLYELMLYDTDKQDLIGTVQSDKMCDIHTQLFMPPRTSGPWVEVGDGPSPITLKTRIDIIAS